MDEKNSEKNKKPPRIRDKVVLPFFIALLVLTVVAFIIPLRPTESYAEKRKLAEFPQFSLEALASGTYFDDISTWFSDTFPGREGWLRLANKVDELHGRSEIAISGEITDSDEIPTRPPQKPTEPTAAPATEAPTEPPQTEAPTEPPQTEPTELVTAPEEPVENWGGVDAGEDAEIIFGNVLQIGDTAFNYFGFSQFWSDYYVETLNRMGNAMAEQQPGVRIISAVIPSSVGVMVEKEYMEKIKCADQEAAIDYINSGFNENVVAVDMFQNLLDHNDEYIYFRTDHHWTGLGAYYAYESVCNTLGITPAPTSDFEVWDQGEFQGSLYWSCPQTSKLKVDYVEAFNPPGDLQTVITNQDGSSFSWTVLTDMSRSNKNAKYMTYLAGDHPLVTITNNDLPDAPSCILVKDSYGNPVAPLLTQNYHKVYAMDFRTYRAMNLKYFSDYYGVDDIIIMPTLAMMQMDGPNKMIRTMCGP